MIHHHNRHAWEMIQIVYPDIRDDDSRGTYCHPFDQRCCMNANQQDKDLHQMS
jgi:hypothetical protein